MKEFKLAYFSVAQSDIKRRGVNLYHRADMFRRYFKNINN